MAENKAMNCYACLYWEQLDTRAEGECTAPLTNELSPRITTATYCCSKFKEAKR